MINDVCSLQEFCDDFDIITNALDMRTLLRWNGRDIRNKENLSEHTHLVVACAISLYDELIKEKPEFKQNIDFEQMIRGAMLHDSMELFRGDILSITKNAVPFLREYIDSEEETFVMKKIGTSNNITKEIVHLADLKACYVFIETELKYVANDFVSKVYKTTKKVFDDAFMDFKVLHKFKLPKEIIITDRYSKGYANDAGIDIVLDDDVEFIPLSTSTINLKIVMTPDKFYMAMLCSRTSAANKGLIVANCPIDPDYNGEILAIVHNVSNDIIRYKKGESFCQLVILPFKPITKNIMPKKFGRRTDGKLGSTDI